MPLKHYKYVCLCLGETLYTRRWFPSQRKRMTYQIVLVSRYATTNTFYGTGALDNFLVHHPMSDISVDDSNDDIVTMMNITRSVAEQLGMPVKIDPELAKFWKVEPDISSDHKG